MVANGQNNRLMVLMKEYDAMRTEILNHLSHHRQILNLFFASISFVAPVLLIQADNIDPIILSGTLYFFSIVYSVILLHTITLQFNIDTCGHYINDYIEPEINKMLPSLKKRPKNLLYWETYMQNLRASNPSIVFVGAVGTIASVLMILLVSSAFIIMANYLVGISAIVNSLPVYITYIKAVAVIFLAVALSGWIVVLYIELYKYKMVRSNQEAK